MMWALFLCPYSIIKWILVFIFYCCISNSQCTVLRIVLSTHKAYFNFKSCTRRVIAAAIATATETDAIQV